MEEETTTATPRKRRRLLENFEERDGGRNNDNEDEGTPRLHRRPEPPPRIESGTPRLPILSMFPRNRTSLLQPHHHQNRRMTFIVSRIEEKLADLEIESRKDIEQLFQNFSAQLRASIAKSKVSNSSPSNIPPHQKTSQTSQKQSNGTTLEMPSK